MIRTVIFDIDNTLYDFAAVNALAIDALAGYAVSHFGWTADKFREEYKWVQDEMLRVAGYYSGGVRNRIIRIQLILEKHDLPLHPHAIRMYDLYWNTLLDNMKAFDGAEEAMRTLKEKGIRIGIGTDMTALMQLRKLTRLGLLSYVDFIVTSEEAGEEKPGKKLFDRCIEKIRCKPEECLFVGDRTDKDYKGAIDAGMKALWYNPDGLPGNEHLVQTGDLRTVPAFCEG